MANLDVALSVAHLRDDFEQKVYQARPARRRTLLNGKLVYGNGIFTPDGALTLDCTIYDISEGGAKVSLTRQLPLPPDLYLIIVKYGLACHARIVWLKFPSRGLQFLQSYELVSVLPAELKFLHRLWSDLGSRSGSTHSPGG